MYLKNQKWVRPFTISIYTNDSIKAEQIAVKAFVLADSLNFILSDYIDSSEINRLSASSGKGVYIHVSEPLLNIIMQAQNAAVLTNGAYDITMGPVVKLWRKARKEKTFPDEDSLKFALQKQVINMFILIQCTKVFISKKEECYWM